MKQRIVGLGGPIHSGKTTVGKFLEENGNFKRLSYATPLKEALVALTGLPMHYFTEEPYKSTVVPEYGKSPRFMMQKLGTEYARNMIHPDFFLIRMRMDIEKYANYHIVIDDIRFENEAALVRSYGEGVVIHLIRDTPRDAEAAAHVSEKPLHYFKKDLVFNVPEGTDKMLNNLYDCLITLEVL